MKSNMVRPNSYLVMLLGFIRLYIYTFYKEDILSSSVPHESNRIELSRIRFGFDSIRTESNFINSDSIRRSRIRIESESNPNPNPNLIRFDESFAEPYYQDNRIIIYLTVREGNSHILFTRQQEDIFYVR